MAIHFGIIADFLNTKNDPAFFDVVNATFGTNVKYTVYQSATGDRVTTVPFNNQFATSPDLFNLGGSPVAVPALVSAETVDPSGTGDGSTSAAVLRQKKLILNAGQNNQFGQLFLVPVGDLGSTSGGRSGASLIVGNPNGGPISVIYKVNGSPQPSVTLDRGGCVAIPLTIAPAIVAVQTTGNAVVALALVGKGQDFAMTLIAPT
jgi:hypothetical protein